MRKTAITSRISYAVGIREGLFSRIERAILRCLENSEKSKSRREISKETGVEICSLCYSLKNLSDVGVIEVEKTEKDAETKRPTMRYILRSK